MPITLKRGQVLKQETDEQFGLECPYCGVYAHLTPQSVPNATALLQSKPKHVGLVFQCDACHAPIFLRFAVKQYSENKVELYQNFIELDRPKERFPFSYLPKHTEVLFREALSCYSNTNFNAFASMCRRSARSAFTALGDGGKLRCFDVAMTAQEIAEIDDDSFDPIKQVLFEPGDQIKTVVDVPALSQECIHCPG